MRRVKQVSITKYITAYLIVLVVFISVFMSLFVNILADRMIHYDIQSTMIRKTIKNNKHVNYDNGELKTDKYFEYEDDDMYFQVLDGDGKVLIGKNPKGIDIPGEIGNQKLHILKEKGKEYYVIDRVNRKLTEATGEIVYSRCIVEKRDIDSKYQTVKYISYGSIPVFMLIVLLSSFVLSRNISEPLTQMSKTAAAIGNEGELSRRMEYGGKIKELSILADTNNHMLERVENMFDTQKQFSSDVAHELRTPLAVLLAQCEYAKEHTDTKEEFEESIDVIYRQAMKTNRIVTKLLKLNRLESGRVVLDLEEADLDEIICSVCDDEELKNKNQVKFQLSLSGVRTQVDIGLALILFQNIIQNAVKYSTLPATVEIMTGYREDNVVISVKDYGCGIKPEDIQKLFTPFYRVEKSRNSEGFGLGLSLADRIAKLHGGNISVESKWGEGSIFTVVLPKR